MKTFRLKITEKITSRQYSTYLTRSEDGCVSYINGDRCPLALSNLVHSYAAELHFQLEDAADGEEACAIVRTVLKRQWSQNPTKAPTVELWTAR